MAKDKFVQTFTGGYNGDASPFVLGETQLATVRNMLFERGLLISRPGISSVNTAATTAFPYAALAGRTDMLQNLGITVYTSSISATTEATLHFARFSTLLFFGNPILVEDGVA